jgi:hypothetical protein
MENFKSDRWVVTSIGAAPGFELPLKFKFSKDETRELETILRSFDKDKVQNFLSRISLFPIIPLYVSFKSVSFPKNAIKKYLLTLKQCQKLLEEILRGFNPDPQRNFNSTRDQRLYRAETPREACFKAAGKAYPHIKILEKTLQELLNESKRGRGRIHTDPEGFVSEVAKLYELSFSEKPARSKGTIFYKLIAKLFDILDPKPKEYSHEPSGAIRRALKKI